MKKRVLYVEDNPNNLLLIKRIIQAEGHTPFEAINGEDGWKIASRERPDLIITDLLMPGTDGFELTRKIRHTPELAYIPVIGLTTHNNPQVEAQAQAAGCNGFLHKPADVPQIQALLRQFLGAAVTLTNS